MKNVPMYPQDCTLHYSSHSNSMPFIGKQSHFKLLLIKAIGLGFVSGQFNFIALLKQMLTEVVNRKYRCKNIRFLDLYRTIQKTSYNQTVLCSFDIGYR